MTKIAIIGAGWMTKPFIDYFIDKCGYDVVMATRTVSKAEKLLVGRPHGTAVQWTTNEPEKLDAIIKDVSVVISMIPRQFHTIVLAACLRQGKHLLTTSYEWVPEDMAKEAEEKGILIVNELGEDPGMDHLALKLLLDEIKIDNSRILDIKSYGSGIPAFDDNRNPFYYKFSWDPRGVFTAANTPGSYYENGEKIEVPGGKLFDSFKIVDVYKLGTFETYVNRDVERYFKLFDLDPGISFYRCLLRHCGYCNNMRLLGNLGLFKSEPIKTFDNTSYSQFMRDLVDSQPNMDAKTAVANKLNVERISDIIHRLDWLGLFKDEKIPFDTGSNLDVLLSLMLKKLAYTPEEKDMTIIHVEILVELDDGSKEKRMRTMVMQGIPNGDSAMSRAVSLPPAITAKLIIEGKVQAKGVHMSTTLPTLYKPLVEELATYGFEFKKQTIKVN